MQFSKLTNDQKEQVIGNITACAKEKGITSEQAQQIKDGKLGNIDGKMKCFINCFLEKTGLIANGKVNSAFVTIELSTAYGNDLKNAQAKCDSLRGSDNCDTAFQLLKCYYANKVTFS